MEQKPVRSSSANNERKNKRKEILEKKKAIDQLIKSAYAETDHLSLFPPFRNYNRNGLSVFLKSRCGDNLSSPLKQYIKGLLKCNMEGVFGSEWPTEEKVKRRDMVSPEARYIIVYEAETAEANEMSARVEKGSDVSSNIGDDSVIVGFVHYRLTVEEEVPVLYVYELQLEPRVQGKGLGKFLVQLTELIARKNHLGAVVLTVQKTNVLALEFYINKLRYNISSISPSKVGVEKNYEILCKTFDQEAKAKLETQ